MNPLSVEKVETVSRPLRLPKALYLVAQQTNALESSLRPVNSTLVEAISLGLPLVLQRIQTRNRELKRCLRDIDAAGKIPATPGRSRGK